MAARARPACRSRRIEPRAAATLHRARHEAAAVLLATSLGAKMYHHGQFDGLQVKLPVHLARKPNETKDKKLHEFYITLLSTVAKMGKISDWQLCDFIKWRAFLKSQVLAWHITAETNSYVVIVNYSRKQAKGRLTLPKGVTSGFGKTTLSSKRRRADEKAILHGKPISLAPWEFAIIRLD